MNNLGISLPPDYLNATPGIASRVFTEVLGPCDQALPGLREAGIDVIELRTIRPDADIAAMREAVSKVIAMGFRLTLHGLLPAEDRDPGDSTAFPLWEVADELRRVQGETTVTVHARFHSDPATPVDALLLKTVQDLKALAGETRRRQAPFRYALEICKFKEKADPSFTWDQVAEMVERVDDPSVGICWDFGHAFYNAVAGLIDARPPERFLQRVIHTHIHDLGPQNQTHWPLTEGKVPVRDYCRSLAGKGYGGVFNLELEPQRYELELHIAQRIGKSIAILSEACSSPSQDDHGK